MSETIRIVCQYSSVIKNAASWMTGLFSVGELEAYSVNDLVNTVKAEVRGSGKVTRLEICAHGSDRSISVGDEDVLHDWRPKEHMPTLSRLKKSFTADGYVVLWVCQAGRLRNVLSELAKTLGVSVYANTGDVNPVAFYAFGQFVVAYPDGEIETDVENVFWSEGESQGAWF
jgi:hypothetical protein